MKALNLIAYTWAGSMAVGLIVAISYALYQVIAGSVEPIYI